MFKQKCDKCGETGCHKISDKIIKKYDLKEVIDSFNFCSNYCFRLSVFAVDQYGKRYKKSFKEIQHYIEIRKNGAKCPVCLKRFAVKKRNQDYCSVDCQRKKDKRMNIKKQKDKKEKKEYVDYDELTLSSFRYDGW